MKDFNDKNTCCIKCGELSYGHNFCDECWSHYMINHIGYKMPKGYDPENLCEWTPDNEFLHAVKPF